MFQSVIEYYLNLPEALHFVKIPEMSSTDGSTYRMQSDYGSGTFQTFCFEDDMLLILIGDYTPKETFEKSGSRLNQALLLLKNSDYGIATIAEKVGYHNSGHFARLFKNAYGLGPREYRKIHNIK